jgi:hypothetical protein
VVIMYSSKVGIFGVFFAFGALAAAQLETNYSSSRHCRPGSGPSGNRTAFIVAVPNATAVDGLGAVDCALGFLPDPPYCAGWAMACPCVVDACATYGGVCSEGACLWQQQSVIPVASVTCGEAAADFVFSGCGCPSGHYFDLSHEPASANNATTPTKCRPCDIGT